MSKFDTLITNRVVQNLFIWFCLFVILVGSIQADNKILTAFYAILFLLPGVYINNLVILPFLKKNMILFILFFSLNVLVFSAILVSIISLDMKNEFEWKMYLNFLGLMVLALTFASAIKIAGDSFLRRQQEKEAELKLLKAQLNPHFLFNTLNNLYGLSVIKSDKLPNLMLKLSDLLRYSLYQTKDAFVPIEKEIQYLENYISLEKIRLEDQADIQFNKSGEFSSIKIAPMLLIVFVENAFKHLGVSKNKQNNVKVDLMVADKKLIFSCINSVDEVKITEQNLESGKSGIGLQNAKKRLNLMYPDTHQLEIKSNLDNYTVKLILNF